ncbi:MAG: 30S ribosomal protein S16 [Gammaproteobacteria bacterium]|jgi:small subunit ribosomal protein S16
MIVIRLARRGAKKRPFYDIVVADKSRSRDGRFIEKLGYFNPIAQGKAVPLEMNLERIQHWINQGAQPSPRMKSLIKEFKKTQEKGAA